MNKQPPKRGTPLTGSSVDRIQLRKESVNLKMVSRNYPN